MSKAEELAQAYADAVSTHRLESLYGTSKSYTLEKAQERDEAHAALTAELRRLAALEKAIMDAEPVAWISDDGAIEESHKPWMDHEVNQAWNPLYTLNGIKP